MAGLTLAIRMADAGYSCMLFEKNTYPFHKVCGEYVSMESWDFIRRLGLNLGELELPQIRRLEVSAPSGKLMRHRLNPGGFGISRYMLDRKLAELAKKKGVVVMENCRVNDIRFEEDRFYIETAAGSCTAKICIGAWGKKSNLDTKLSRRFSKKSGDDKNYVGIKYHIRLDFPDDLIQLHNFEGGYCGISKIEESKYCLCYLSVAEHLKNHRGDIKKMEAEVLMKNPLLEKIFSRAIFLTEVPVTVSNIRIGYKEAVSDHLLMLGDAAGNIAPLSGNGMSMAMRSSFMLGGLLEEYMSAAISRAELEKKYAKAWRSRFKKRIELSAFLQRLLKSTRLTGGAIAFLKVFPFVRKAVVRSTHGKPF